MKKTQSHVKLQKISEGSVKKGGVNRPPRTPPPPPPMGQGAGLTQGSRNK